MPTTTAAEPLTKLVRIVNDDETFIEVQITAALAKQIRRMGWAEEKAEQRHRRRQKTMTDLGIDPGRVEDRPVRRAPKPKAPEKRIPGVSYFTPRQARFYLDRFGRDARDGLPELEGGDRLLGPRSPHCKRCPTVGGCNRWW